jgi:hypothetical protein
VARVGKNCSPFTNRKQEFKRTIKRNKEMKKLLILSALLGSCAVPKLKPKPHPVHKFKSRQELIMDCYKLLRRLGEDGERATTVCFKLYEKEK